MKNYKNKLIYCLKYFLFWVIYFVFARAFFLLYYIDKTKELDVTTIFKTFTFGIQLDLAFTGYLCAIPFLLISFSSLINPKAIVRIIKWFTFLILFFLNLMLLIDAGLYQSWGVRIDSSLLPYLNTPELMIASASTLQIITGTIFWLLISFIFIKIYIKNVHKTGLKILFENW